MIIQIIGLPGSGKTALAKSLTERLNAILLNGDDVRRTLSSDLSFSPEDRIEQARRMGAVADILSRQGQIVVADFVCPTRATRKTFGSPDILIWVDRIDESIYEDTNMIWEPPDDALRIAPGLTVEEEADIVISLCGLHDWKEPVTLMLGRYQPWHEGHDFIQREALADGDKVLIGVRATSGTSEKDPFTQEEVLGFIRGKVKNPFVVRFPNITRIVYGRDVGYRIDQIDAPAHIAAITATDIRNRMKTGE
jgi:hypothetical protein